MRSGLHAMVMVVLLCGGASAQERDTALSVSATLVHDGGRLLQGTAAVLTMPLHWEGTDWVRAGALTAATGASSLLDDEVSGLMKRNVTPGAGRVSDIVVEWGDDVAIVGATGVTYGVGLLFHQTWLRETSLMAGTALLVSGTVSTVTKVVVGRARPYKGLGNHTFRPFTFSDDSYFSFPSGHAVVAFSLSTVLARRIRNPWATVGLYLLAAGTAASRMYTQHHWFSDVVAGGALATAASASVVSWFEGNDGDHAAFHIIPRGNGIAFVLVL